MVAVGFLGNLGFGFVGLDLLCLGLSLKLIHYGFRGFVFLEANRSVGGFDRFGLGLVGYKGFGRSLNWNHKQIHLVDPEYLSVFEIRKYGCGLTCLILDSRFYRFWPNCKRIFVCGVRGSQGCPRLLYLIGNNCLALLGD